MSRSNFIILVFYVEDILLTSNNIDLLHESKHFLSRNFDMKDLGEASYVIRIEIHRDRANGTLGLSQKAYIERILNRFQSNLGLLHWKAAKKVLQYLQGTKEYKLTYTRSDNLEFIGYSNSDFVKCKDTRKSTSGYIFMLSDVSFSNSNRSTRAGLYLDTKYLFVRVGIKRLLDDLRVTAVKLMLLVYKLLLLVFRVNAAGTKLQLLKDYNC
ncbi:retrovirus-related pol polyprotein from transposon TNT 1-94 [Tanacetum coccineum]